MTTSPNRSTSPSSSPGCTPWDAAPPCRSAPLSRPETLMLDPSRRLAVPGRAAPGHSAPKSSLSWNACSPRRAIGWSRPKTSSNGSGTKPPTPSPPRSTIDHSPAAGQARRPPTDRDRPRGPLPDRRDVMPGLRKAASALGIARSMAVLRIPRLTLRSQLTLLYAGFFLAAAHRRPRHPDSSRSGTSARRRGATASDHRPDATPAPAPRSSVAAVTLTALVAVVTPRSGG